MLLLCAASPAEPLCISPWKGEIQRVRPLTLCEGVGVLCFFWVPAFAGMTWVRGNDVVLTGMAWCWRGDCWVGVHAFGHPPRNPSVSPLGKRREKWVRPLTLCEGGGVGVLCLFWVDVPSAEAPACAGMTWFWRE